MKNFFIINQNNLINNLKSLKCKNVCAMLKADAYGHNVKYITKILCDKVDFFGVANLDEALEIRKFDKHTKILVVGLIDDYISAINNNISFTVDSSKQLNKILSQKTKKKAKIHIAVNTGMNRLGVGCFYEYKKMLKILRLNSKKIIFEGLFTHFATSDCDKSFFKKQKNRFQKYIKRVPKKFSPIISLGGSGVIKNLNPNILHKFMFRVGIDLYTTPHNVLEIKSELVKVFEVKKNQRVGYSNAFIANENKKIGIVPLGYYDGINRNLGNNAYVKINNCYCKIIGNVCMDMFFVDLSQTNTNVGDLVTVFNNSFYWAEICQTIPYEILTNIKYKRMKIKISK